MAQEPSCEVEVAVLKQQVSDLKEIVLKLEEAIERINDVNLNVIKMLAAHEERIIHNEQNDQNLFAKIVELEVKINNNKDELTKEIIGIRTKIIPIVTAVVIAGFIISNSEFFGKLLHNENGKKSLLTNPPLYGMIV
jgi:hypothetical protein